MPAARASALFDEFLAIAAAAYHFTYGSLGRIGLSGEMTAHFERLLGIPSRDGHFNLDEQQTKLCLSEIIRYESAAQSGTRPYLLLQSIAVTQWRIDGKDFATDSTFNMNYGILPCLSTSLRFDTIEHFHSIQRVLNDIKLCKLDARHLRPVKMRKLKE